MSLSFRRGSSPTTRPLRCWIFSSKLLSRVGVIRSAWRKWRRKISGAIARPPEGVRTEESIPIRGAFRRFFSVSTTSSRGRCLDAAHGEAAGTMVAMQRAQFANVVAQERSKRRVGGHGRRSPIGQMRSGCRHGSRRVEAVARSRRKKQSLKGMRRRGKQHRI